jgi:hypothetical protein
LSSASLIRSLIPVQRINNHGMPTSMCRVLSQSQLSIRDVAVNPRERRL